MVLHPRLELRGGRSCNLKHSFKVYSELGLDILIPKIRLSVTKLTQGCPGNLRPARRKESQEHRMEKDYDQIFTN